MQIYILERWINDESISVRSSPYKSEKNVAYTRSEDWNRWESSPGGYRTHRLAYLTIYLRFFRSSASDQICEYAKWLQADHRHLLSHPERRWRRCRLIEFRKFLKIGICKSDLRGLQKCFVKEKTP